LNIAYLFLSLWGLVAVLTIAASVTELRST